MEKFTLLAKILHCCRQWRQWQISPLAPRVLVGAPWGLVQHFSQDCLGFLLPQVPRCVFPCHFLAQKGIKRELFWHHDLNIRGPCMWLECWMIICAGEFAVKALLEDMFIAWMAYVWDVPVSILRSTFTQPPSKKFRSKAWWYYARLTPTYLASEAIMEPGVACDLD